MSDITNEQICLLRDIRLKGAVMALLSSEWKHAGPALRSNGFVGGVGDGTVITPKGMDALRQADARLKRATA